MDIVMDGNIAADKEEGGDTAEKEEGGGTADEEEGGVNGITKLQKPKLSNSSMIKITNRIRTAVKM